MNKNAVASSVLVVTLAAAAAHADFVVPDGVTAPWVRGTSSPSAYAQWESFTTVAGPNTPDVGQNVVGTLAGGAPAFGIGTSGATASVLGSGNIYSGNAPLNVTVTVPGFGADAGVQTYLLLQTRTQGTEINPATMLINGVAPTLVNELSRVSLGAQGFQVETAWAWALPASASSFTITFSSGGPFFSLDRVAVDEFVVVPAPSAGAVLAFGLVAAGRRRR